MKALLIRCGICLDWHSPKHHCFNCGAFRLVVNRQVRYFNAHTNVEMVRGIPMPLHATIARHCEERNS